MTRLIRRVSTYLVLLVLFISVYFLSHKIHSIYAADSPLTQTDWSGGVGPSTTSQFSESSNISFSTTGEIKLPQTSSWYNSSWTKRKKITFDNSAQSENLVNFPVLIKRTSSDTEFWSNIQPNCQDLRFVDHDGTVLKYEIEQCNHTTDALSVWVKVPQINASSSTDYIYLYYGNSEAVDGQDPTNVWNSNYVGVWHMNEDPSGVAPQIQDSTINNIDGTSEGAMPTGSRVDGLIASAINFDGSNDRISIGNPSVVQLNNGTLEAWINTTNAGSSYRGIIGKQTAYGMFLNSNTFGLYDWGGGAWRPTPINPNDGNWRHLVCSFQSGVANGTRCYVDGALQLTTQMTVSGQGVTLYIAEANASQFFTGKIDEVRISSTVRSAAWIAASYKSGNNTLTSFEAEESVYPAVGSLTSNIFDTGFMSDWGLISYTYSGSATVKVRVRTDSNSNMSGASSWDDSCNVSNNSDLTDGSCIEDADRYIQYQVIVDGGGTANATFSDITINFTRSDQISPSDNATTVVMTGRDNEYWANPDTLPELTWIAGEDDLNGSGILGYCIAIDEAPIGQSNLLDPEISSGKLTGRDDGIEIDTCPYIISESPLNLSALFPKDGNGLTDLVSNKQYYISLKAIDNAGNIFSGSSSDYQDFVSFKYDETKPTNVSFILTPGGNFSNVEDMYFSWPGTGTGSASDGHSLVLGYQYQINSTDQIWLGTQNSTFCNLSYIPQNESSYSLTDLQDGTFIDEGNNVIYFRTVDNACNISTSATYRTGNLSYGGDAPSFGGADVVTVTPSTNTENSFSLSWPSATATDSTEIGQYYYMINTSPPATYQTLISNTSTYIANGTSTSVSTKSLTNVNKGTNTVYVVAVDNADNPNYSPSNYISGTFTLNSTDPDNVSNLVASDSSIKSQSQWNVTLTWTAPSYQGAGNLTYIIFRSSDGSNFSQVGSSTGLSYVDNTPLSKEYFYKIYTKDGANAQSSGTNAVSITPTGKWTTPPGLESDPQVSNITTKRATIRWSTDRVSDSKISYGKSGADYFGEEPSKSDLVTSHEINLTNLTPGTRYNYQAKWTDEDGNTGVSDEFTFTTAPAPSVSAVKETDIGISSAYIVFSVKDASKASVLYGKSISYGGIQSISTSTSNSTYSLRLSELEDGTIYHYKLSLEDSEGDTYEFEDHTFETLPRPKISNIRVQQVLGAAQPSILVTWDTNTFVSSIVTYYPEGNPSAARDEINLALQNNQHKMLLRGLVSQTAYVLVVKGRDKVGNEAESAPQRFTTATDTRPPQISDLKIEGITTARSTDNTATSQLVVTWNTDEPATSQVEFGEGTGGTYSQKSHEDSNLTYNHIVVLSNLNPSKVYHLRAISKDKMGNISNSIDNVSITPKATENALYLVIQNLQDAFGFINFDNFAE